jgi:hypothetical protein
MMTEDIFARIREISGETDITRLLENIVDASDDWPDEEKAAFLKSSDEEKAAFLKEYYYLES